MTLDSLIERAISEARRVGDINQMFRNQEGGLKKDELAQRKYATDAQYGAGGASDREMLARERMAGVTAGTAANQLAAQKPGWDAAAELNRAQAGELNFKLGMGQELRPDSIAAARSTYGLNTALAQGETTGKLDAAYTQANTRALAMPAYSTPYQKVAPEQPRGWLSKLWQGDLYNPFSTKNADELMKKRKINALNESFLATNPSYR